MIYGYARVSTSAQSLQAQVDQLKAAGAQKLFQETVSGAKSDRKELGKLMKLLGSGDVLLVTRLDRLARSTRDLLNMLATITEKGIGFRCLGDTWADTTTAQGRLMITIFGGLAEFERELIRTRIQEGRARAKAKGNSLGRKPKMTGFQRSEALERRASGESLKSIGRSYNVSEATICRLGGTREFLVTSPIRDGGSNHV